MKEGKCVCTSSERYKKRSTRGMLVAMVKERRIREKKSMKTEEGSGKRNQRLRKESLWPAVYG